ncbi:hypothetical protein FRC07_003211, partial [Ceratobasidium sp. 392]
ARPGLHTAANQSSFLPPCLVLQATIVQQRTSEYYVHYHGLDKRLDEWVPMNAVEIISNPPTAQTLNPELQNEGATRGKKRNRTTGPTTASHSDTTLAVPDRSTTPQEDPPDSLTNHLPSALGPSLHTRDQTEAAQQHRALTARRNFDHVNFDDWHIKTWYFSPYPSFDDDTETHTRPRATPEGPGATPAAPPGAAVRSATAMGLSANAAASASNTATGASVSAASGDATLWVCDRCFKYMRDGTAWQLHKASISPPPIMRKSQAGFHVVLWIPSALGVYIVLDARPG